MGYLLLGVVSLVTYYIVSSIASWYRLRDFKGPFLASFSWTWLAFVSQSGHSDKLYPETQKKYKDPLIRIAPDFLMTDSADIIRHINSARSSYKRDDWYLAFRIDPYVHSMLSTTDDAMHKSLKSRTNPAYAGHDVPGLEAGIDSQIQSFKDLIRRKYLSTSHNLKPMDMAAAVQYYTLDAVTKVGFGKEWGFMKADADLDSFIASVCTVAPFMSLCTDIPLARNFFMSPFMLKLMGPKYTDKHGFGNLMRVSKDAVAKRFTTKLEHDHDMLESFIRHGLTQQECEAEIPTLVIAGSDTTAGVIRSGLLYLMTSPLVYQRLQAEIDDAIKTGKASSPITNAEAKRLPYLQAVIYETVRMQPPNQILMPKVVPPDGDLLLGKYRVPAGTRIGVNVTGVQRDEKMYGKDVNLFRPERFMEVDKAKRVEMERQVDLVWSTGRYICSGKMVAIMELNKIFVGLMRDFDFQLVDPQTPWKKRLHIVYFLKDMWVKITERQR